MPSQLISKIAAGAVIVGSVLCGVTFGSASAGAVGSVTSFCGTNYTVPHQPPGAYNPTPAQARVLERFGLRVVGVLMKYSNISPTEELSKDFMIAASDLRSEVKTLRNGVIENKKYMINHHNIAARNAVIRDIRAFANEQAGYNRIFGSIDVLTAQACPPVTTTTVPASTTTTLG